MANPSLLILPGDGIGPEVTRAALRVLEAGLPVDLVFQSIGGTAALNRSFGIDLALLREAHDAARTTGRGGGHAQRMYFETGQGSALSADAHHGIDQQTCEARAYAVARAFQPSAKSGAWSVSAVRCSIAASYSRSSSAWRPRSSSKSIAGEPDRDQRSASRSSTASQLSVSGS